jgi:hypothetical protein
LNGDEAKALKIWFDEDNLRLLLTDGRQLPVPLAYFPRLLKADKNLLGKYEISGGGTSLAYHFLHLQLPVVRMCKMQKYHGRQFLPRTMDAPEYSRIFYCEINPIPQSPSENRTKAI